MFASLASGQLGDYFRVIYIVRDPRDVAISAAHHFRVNFLSTQPGSSKLAAALRERGNRAFPYFLKRRRTIRAVLYGDPSISDWLATPWRDHYVPFRQSDTLILRYEDLLDDPVRACVDLAYYLGVSRSDESIAKAICKQSFQTMKDFFKSQGLMSEYAFLRRGSYGYWRDELNRSERQLFIDELEEELRSLNYPID